MPVSMMQPDLKSMDSVKGVRASALARWQERGWPGPKEEGWRFTRLSSLEKLRLRPADKSHARALPTFSLANVPDDSFVIRFHNGILVQDSLDGAPDGIKL